MPSNAVLRQTGPSMVSGHVLQISKFGSRRASQRQELAIWCLPPGMPHSIRSWHYCVWARACPTQHPELVIWQQMQQVQQARRRRRRRTRRMRKGVKRRRRKEEERHLFLNQRPSPGSWGNTCYAVMHDLHAESTRAPLLSRRDQVPTAKMRLSLSTMRWFFSGVLQPHIRKHNHSVNSNTMEPKAILYNTLLPNIFCSMTITRCSTIRLTYIYI